MLQSLMFSTCVLTEIGGKNQLSESTEWGKNMEIIHMTEKLSRCLYSTI